jgi:hypothetical protein
MSLGRRAVLCGAALTAGLATMPAAPAGAAVVNMRATLSGAQTVPPNASPATGSASIRIDTQLNALLYQISYSGLTSPETVSFIHGYAPPGMNAGSRHVLPSGNPKVATWIYPEADEASILGGLAYVLIHTTAFPAGEIRGQIVPALPPEGADSYTATAQIQIEIVGVGATTLAAAGPTVVRRGEPAPSGAAETQAAEILALEWSGANPLLGAVTVRPSTLYASTGTIRSAAGTAFPATSTFDAYLEISTPSGTYFNRNRLRLESTIHAIPPIGDTYSGADILLYRHGTSEGTVAGRITQITFAPDSPFIAAPPAGSDCLDSELHMQVTVNGTGVEHVIGLGRLLLTRGAPVVPGDGRVEVPIEIAALDLAAPGKIVGDVRVIEVTPQPSTGVAKAVSPGTPFPMDVDVDAQVEIEFSTLGRTLVPQVPPHLHGLWNALPQIGIAIDASNLPAVLLDKVSGMPAGSLDFFYIVPDSTCALAPPAAVELFTATGSATVELFGSGTAAVALAGNAVAVRGPGRDAGGGTVAVDTELRALALAGSAAPVGTVGIREDPSRASTGHVTGTDVGVLLPATAGFSVFVAVQTSNGVLRPAAPVPIAATAPLTVLPAPGGTTYAQSGGPIDLKDASGITRGRLSAWTLVMSAATPWPTDAAPPAADDIALAAVLGSVVPERNPVRGTARFRVALDRTRDVALHIYDVRGARVRAHGDAPLAAGTRIVEWDGRDDTGRDTGAGLYFYRIVIDGRERRGKLVRLR